MFYVAAHKNVSCTVIIGGSRGARPACAPHLPGILVFETYFFQFHALFT